MYTWFGFNMRSEPMFQDCDRNPPVLPIQMPPTRHCDDEGREWWWKLFDIHPSYAQKTQDSYANIKE